jgi:hypothetical protein
MSFARMFISSPFRSRPPVAITTRRVDGDG